MHCEVNLPKDSFNYIGDDIYIHDVHKTKVKIDVCVVSWGSKDKIVCDGRPSSFEKDLYVYILRIHQGLIVSILLIG